MRKSSYSSYNKSLNFIFIILTYSFVGILFNFLTGNSSFTFLYDRGFDKIFQFIFVGQHIHSIERQLAKGDESFYFLYFGLFFLFMATCLLYNTKKIIFSKSFFIFKSSDNFNILQIKKKEAYIYIAIASALGLFLELAIIRIHSSYLQLFGYLKNISLLSCFLGLGIGLIFKDRKFYSIKWVYPLFFVQITLMYCLYLTPAATILMNPIAEQWTMGQDMAKGFLHLLIVYLFIILIFLFNALCFIPIGHLITKLMSTIEKLEAYSCNLIGSIVGVIVIAFLSYLWTSPIIWISVSFLMYFILINKVNTKMFLPIISFLGLVIILNINVGQNKKELYSPYQNITVQYQLNELNPVLIKISHIWHQVPLDLYNDSKDPRITHEHQFYDLAYKIVETKPNKILIVGSGTGNDVASAFKNVPYDYNTDLKVDAVEIDPLIARLGKEYHPNSPYSNEKLNLIIEDARTFIKNTKNKYDLIQYGLLDSLTNLSGRGGIRLDSYVYTVEAFREAREKLSNEGFIYLSFFIQTPELGFKIFSMLKKAFNGITPIVMKDKENDRYIFVISENMDQFEPHKLSGKGITDFEVTEVFQNLSSKIKIDLSTDDWPFFYMTKRVYPLTYLLLLSLLFLSSLFYIKKLTRISKKNFSVTCFFLGAGFMLLETKGITELAKIYGSTWMVVSVIIVSVLLMAYFANLVIIKKFNISHNQIYLFLIASLLCSFLLSFTTYFDESIFLPKLIIPFFLTFPIFFSGLAFSNELSSLDSASTALSSNILGAMFGGFLEYNSMYFGLKFLYLLAIILYFASYIFSKKNKN